MSGRRGRNGSPRPSGEESILSSRSLEAFGRKVTATAGHLIGPIGEGSLSQHYSSALGDLHRELRHPLIQRQVFSLSQASPRELFRSKLSVIEIQHRAATYIPDELLANVPTPTSQYSLFQGFEATLPERHGSHRRGRHGRHGSGSQRLLGEDKGDTPVSKLRNEKHCLDHKLVMFEVRKNMCSTEIREIDNKIANLNSMRKVVLDRLAGLEQEEAQLEHELQEVDTKLEDLEEELADEAALAGQKTPTQSVDAETDPATPDDAAMEASFMSESIYQKLPSPKAKRPKTPRRRTTHILHEHLQSGSKIREMQAHNDTISALDFDVPFGTMVTAALDDTVRVWDLNAGRCMGLLEGHLSSVRCLQVDDNLVATGSMDASVRLWDLNQADYTPQVSSRVNKTFSDTPYDYDDDDEPVDEAGQPIAPPPPSGSSMRDCALFTLNAHVAEITALHFQNTTLVSGSADKTLRQWDLVKGRCVQTLDVLWAAAQASASIQTNPPTEMEPAAPWRQTGRAPDASADFVGAVQCFDAALACGTADGLVRLWDLRSGQVHRSLVGHTGPVTSLQFDDMLLVTGSLDRSIRIWDLRTGSIYDAFAYDNPITSMMFDARRIVAAAGEDVVKVYDKTDGRHWDCGAGADISAGTESGPLAAADLSEGKAERGALATVERVRIRDGYLVEGRRDGVVGVWSC